MYVLYVKMKYLFVLFICVQEFGYFTTAKGIYGRDSIFVISLVIVTYSYSIFWETGRDMDLFVSEPGLVRLYSIYNLSATYMIIIYEIIWVKSHLTPPLTPYSYNQSSKILEQSPWSDYFLILSMLHIVIIPYSVPAWSCLLLFRD